MSLGPLKWEMSPADRVVIMGLLRLLDPENVLEIGCNEGGCTGWLCRHAAHVYAVDVVNKIGCLKAKYDNLQIFHMSSRQAFEIFRKNKTGFDLVIVDGDHSAAGAAFDLENAMALGKIILLHDVYNPDCRAGYEAALDKASRGDRYVNLNFTQGSVHPDGLWGGLGLIISGVDPGPLAASANSYDYFRFYQDEMSRRRQSPLKRIAGKIKRFVKG